MKNIFKNIGVKVSIISILINFFLFLFKLIVGIIASSHALISDAVHSLSDVITTFAVILGLVISNKEADSNHPYGHERIESVFAIILSFFLFLTGIGIGFVGIKAILNIKNDYVTPGALALIAAFVSIVVKEGMFRYTRKVARKISSSAMEADAWHHRSDALSSIGSFFGILGSRMGFYILDPLCSFLIAILIVKVSIEIFLTATNQMLDTACDEELEKQIVDTVIENAKTVTISDLKTRMFGNKVYVDLELQMDGNSSLNLVTKTKTKIHDKLEKEIPSIKHCNVNIIARSKQ